MDAELSHWDFDKIVADSKSEWREKISRITVSFYSTSWKTCKKLRGGSFSFQYGREDRLTLRSGVAEPGLLAHLFVAKYNDHLPFYRQIEMFKRDHGWAIHKSIINDWFAACCTLLELLCQALRKTSWKQ